jgi:hypothetical protein
MKSEAVDLIMPRERTGEGMDKHTAFLSSEGRYTIFQFGKDRLKFIAPYSLVKYIRIKDWDAGYIVVMTKYSHSEDEIEEYIDLCPILDNLYMDKKRFLEPIRNVEVNYD